MCFLVKQSLDPASALLSLLLNYLIGVNLFWSAFNLLPMLPMDGGHVSNALLIRFFGRRGFLFAQLIALVVAAAGIAWGLGSSGGEPQYWMIFLLIFGLRAFSAVAAYFRGDIPDPKNAALIPFNNAQTLYRQGQLPSAKQVAEQALEAASSQPRLRSQIHHLLGWIAVKEGNGRAALDHFSQIQGRSVEPHALAAAFSLIGDEERALPLWELAYRESRDTTILHEWAGTLIRAGRVEQARKLPGVDMALAYTCAERVLFIRGEFTTAAQIGVAALEENPSADRAYDVACAMARAGDTQGALRLLERAAELGFQKVTVAASDPDLASLHTEPRFQAWLSQLQNSVAR
jgi:tetratricopeptide (TPR) repeat protein